MLKVISEHMQVFLQFANVCIILFGFYKFMGKPHSSLEQRVKDLEKRMDETEKSLKAGNKRFNGTERGLTIIMKSIIALIEWEFQYCSDEHKIPSDSLKKAKTDLNEYLAESKNYNEDP